MKLKCFKFFLLISFGCLACQATYAQEEKPCLIFFGDSESSENLDIEKYNKIQFDKDFFIISSSDDEEIEPVYLDYVTYNKWKFGITTPSVSEIESIISEKDSFFFYSTETKSLKFINPKNEKCTVCVMTSEGRLVLTTTISQDATISVAHLAPGYYIAFVNEKPEMKAIKFIK